MSSECKTVFVVDDHPLIRKGLCDAVNAQSDLTVCGEAQGIEEASSALSTTTPDILVLDLNLKDGNGCTLMERLTCIGKLPPTLILSVNDEHLYAARMIRCGAQGYLMKGSSIEDSLSAIRKVLAGHVAVSDAVATSLMKPESTSSNDIDQLSDRELQVFEMLAAGLNNDEMGKRIGISAKTIGTYKARLMKKLGARTTPQLIPLIAKLIAEKHDGI